MSGRGHGAAAPRLGFSLPESKFRPPAARTGIVARTALVERLAATQAQVITVIAPPGYGKTTLLAQWAERVGSHAAWLSCDDGDNDPVVLLSALAVALDRIRPVDPAIFSALASSGADISVVPRFVSAIASVQPPVTVLLDHAEAIASRQCLNTIAEFALRLPPGWQLALASRAELPLPTARLRAEGGILEVTADDLAMGPLDAAHLLKGAGAEVDEAALHDLLQRTEGWPTGLYIAALAMNSGTPHSDVGFTFTSRSLSRSAPPQPWRSACGERSPACGPTSHGQCFRPAPLRAPARQRRLPRSRHGQRPASPPLPSDCRRLAR
jgi:LuxR family maltose regulon positive regulatory protein